MNKEAKSGYNARGLKQIGLGLMFLAPLFWIYSSSSVLFLFGLLTGLTTLLTVIVVERSIEP